MESTDTEIHLGRALECIRREIAEQIKDVTNGKHAEVTRQRRWLAIKSIQRAEALMREALEIVSC